MKTQTECYLIDTFDFLAVSIVFGPSWCNILLKILWKFLIDAVNKIRNYGCIAYTSIWVTRKEVIN